MNAPATKPIAAKPEDPGPQHYFLLPEDEHDEAAGREYLNAKYGEGNAKTSKRVTAIRIGRLTEEHTVICVVRRKPTEGLKKVQDEVSKRMTTIRPDPLLGIVECEPVHCANYWVASEYEDGDGVLNMAGFLEAVGKACTPVAPRYRPDDQILKLRHT